jgi:hypothetical protein
MPFDKMTGKASRLNPLPQRSGNAGTAIETRVLFRPPFVGAPSGAMPFDKMAGKASRLKPAPAGAMRSEALNSLALLRA